jgi:hypothetical protein
MAQLMQTYHAPEKAGPQTVHRIARTVHNQINSGEKIIVSMRAYPSNHVGSIGKHLGTGPHIPYIYIKGYCRLRGPQSIQSIKSTLFTLFFIAL